MPRAALERGFIVTPNQDVRLKLDLPREGHCLVCPAREGPQRANLFASCQIHALLGPCSRPLYATANALGYAHTSRKLRPMEFSSSFQVMATAHRNRSEIPSRRPVAKRRLPRTLAVFLQTARACTPPHDRSRQHAIVLRRALHSGCGNEHGRKIWLRDDSESTS
jgi:hypothetical protein